MELQYCIDCQTIVDMTSENFHILNKYADKDWLICDGPFASCPPPEYDLDYWEWLFLQEPDEEFMEISNQGLMYSG